MTEAAAFSPLTATGEIPELLPRRALALLIDLLILALAGWLLSTVYGVTTVTSGVAPRPGAAGSFSFETGQQVPWLLTLGTWLGYYIVLEGFFGATPGKLSLGLRVVSTELRRPSWGAVVVRNLFRLVDSFPFLYLTGGIAVMASARHQRLGDRVARTVVLPAHLAADAVRPRRALLAKLLALGLIAGGAASAAFYYYGRPPLVVQGAINTENLFDQPLQGYDLGAPVFKAGTVKYPITFHRPGKPACTGMIWLNWRGFANGWELGAANWSCPRLAS
jgi:uncharacterized RDD family membrane protein YckC